jgi:hypothetical protein
MLTGTGVDFYREIFIERWVWSSPRWRLFGSHCCWCTGPASEWTPRGGGAPKQGTCLRVIAWRVGSGSAHSTAVALRVPRSAETRFLTAWAAISASLGCDPSLSEPAAGELRWSRAGVVQMWSRAVGVLQVVSSWGPVIFTKPQNQSVCEYNRPRM